MVRPIEIVTGTDPTNGLNPQARGRLSSGASRCEALRTTPFRDDVQSKLTQLCAAAHGGANSKIVATKILRTLRIGNAIKPAEAHALASSLEKHFPPRVMVEVLDRLDAHERQDHRMRQLYRLRRHPYLGTSRGLILPYSSSVAVGLSYTIRLVLRASDAYLNGVLKGLAVHLAKSDIDRLKANLRSSSIVNAVLPIVFLSGVAVGIVRDVIKAIRGMVELVGNIGAIVDAAREFVSAILKDPEIAFEFGLLTGRELAKDVRRISKYNPIRFTFELGSIIGPTVVYILLALLGVPQVIHARLVAGLARLVRRFPKLRNLARRLGKAAVRATDRQIDEALDRTFEGGLNERAYSTTNRLKRGLLGEKLAVDSLATKGHTIIDYKPDIVGTNQGGIDIVTLKDRYVYMIDNKALSRSGNVSSVSALTTNYQQNLAAVRRTLERLRNTATPPEQRLVLERALDAINNGRIRKAVTNANLTRDTKILTGVTRRLRDQVIEFINVFE